MAVGRWPGPAQITRIRRLTVALTAAEAALTDLAGQTARGASSAAGTAVAVTGQAEPPLIASQLPAAEQAAATTQFAGRVAATALDAIVARTAGQIESATRPLAADAAAAMRRALIRGVALGDNPNTVAGQMLAQVRRGFDGGLARARVIARTEILDAYREASRYAHMQNSDVLSGWEWRSARDRRTCPSCWAMDGTVHPLDQPGPLDHQQGRCVRLPKTKTWADLGINLTEPADVGGTAQDAFARLPRADQATVMGPARLALLDSGRIDWDQLPVRRDTPGWRTSYAPRPVADLSRLARPAA